MPAPVPARMKSWRRAVCTQPRIAVRRTAPSANQGIIMPREEAAIMPGDLMRSSAEIEQGRGDAQAEEGRGQPESNAQVEIRSQLADDPLYKTQATRIALVAQKFRPPARSRRAGLW